MGCRADAEVSGSYEVGGLVGDAKSTTTVNACCSSGAIAGNRETGGLVGYNRAKLVNCYSTARVSGPDCGGLVGENAERS